MINVAVVGAGSFGQKRAEAVKACQNGRLVAVADKDGSRAEAAAKKLNVRALSPEEVWVDPSVEAVVIAAPNKFHVTLVESALSAGKHVLCEKPLARNVAEARRMVSAASRTGLTLKTGSNHRYFASIRKAREIFTSGLIGEVISFNGRIGHNGERVKDTWFWDKDIAGGGTLLDNGCHLMDIARWFMGDFVEACGMTANVYWKDCPVEDTASGVFATADGRLCTINSSWRQLSGYFFFEVNGSEGYLTVDGRFDTHGGDRIYRQSRRDGGVIHSLDFGHLKPDSYVLELEDFFDALADERPAEPSGQDGLEVIKMVEAIYESHGRKVSIPPEPPAANDATA